MTPVPAPAASAAPRCTRRQPGCQRCRSTAGTGLRLRLNFPGIGSNPAAPSVEEPFSPAGVNTIFQRPPTPTDFKVPSRGKTAGDTEAFRTISVSAAMLIEDRAGLPGTHHRLGLLTIIGRTQDNQIVVPTKEVSRRHAEIVMTDGSYVVKDLGSPNGTFVNGERVTEHRLQEGDKITLGGKVFVFKAP